MNISVPINVYTIGLALTVAAWTFAFTRRQDGDYDFGPAVIGAMVTISTVCFWGAVLLTKVLR